MNRLHEQRELMLNINAVHKRSHAEEHYVETVFPLSKLAMLNQSQCYSIEAINSHFILLRFSPRHYVVSTAGRLTQRARFSFIKSQFCTNLGGNNFSYRENFYFLTSYFFSLLFSSHKSAKVQGFVVSKKISRSITPFCLISKSERLIHICSILSLTLQSFVLISQFFEIDNDKVSKFLFNQ